MKRKITDKLIEWKNNPKRKPLVLKGVRQCGKTYILKEFGAEHYSDVCYFNFEEDPSLCGLFEQDFDVKRIITELGILRGKVIRPDDTLIIFDEIQECPNALTSLKYFCENASEYHIVCAGSLLGIAIHKDRSFPVGKVDFLTLYPMSFCEFLEATEGEELVKYYKKIDITSKISEPIALRLSTALRYYTIVGGMPEAVKAWVDTKDIDEIEKIQQQILSGYELYFVKHATPKEFPKLSAIWASIPQQLSKPNSKFIFSQVKKGYRAKDLEDALEWLISAGLIYKVCKIEKPYMPLSAYADASSFKLYLSDVGLLRRLARVPAAVVLDSSAVYTEFKGAMTENYVLNELMKQGCEQAYYWSSGNQAEVDFVIQRDAEIIPIEVKSERNFKARSLSEYIRKYEPKYAILTSMKNDGSNTSVLHVPLYLIGLTDRLVQN